MYKIKLMNTMEYIVLHYMYILYTVSLYEGESIKNQPNFFLGEFDLFFFDVIAL